MIREIVIALVFAALAQEVRAEVLAKVGKAEITVEHFKERYAEVKKQTINPPPPDVFLDDLIRFEIGVQQAEKLKIENDPTVHEAIRKELYKGLLEKEVGKKVEDIQVTEAEMRSYYDKNPEIRSSHILIEYKADSTQAQRDIAHKRALEIYEEVKKSKRPFEELVKLYSDDALSKPAGGDIGFQNRITVVPTYYDLLQKLKTNEIGGPVQTPYGFHIVKVTGRRSFQDADRTQIRAAVFDQKRKVFFDQYFKSIAGQYKVTRDEKLVKALK